MEQATVFPSAEKDAQLWALAKKRAAFKYHMINYLVVNAFLWALWYFAGSNNSYGRQIPWPVYPMLGWGIGLCFHYVGAYVFPGQDQVELEYRKLVEQIEVKRTNKNL
jgi:hypothetical protein